MSLHLNAYVYTKTERWLCIFLSYGKNALLVPPHLNFISGYLVSSHLNFISGYQKTKVKRKTKTCSCRKGLPYSLKHGRLKVHLSKTKVSLRMHNVIHECRLLYFRDIFLLHFNLKINWFEFQLRFVIVASSLQIIS